MEPQHDAVDETLRRMEVWTPPAGFARRTANLGAAVIETPPVARWSWLSLRAVTTGTLAGLGVYATAYLVDLLVGAMTAAATPAVALWFWVALAYGMAALAVRSTISA